MDNLTHFVTGVAISTVCLRNSKVSKYTGRIILVGMLANFPDIDFIFCFFDTQLYANEHRGFTHSIIGLFFMIPIMGLLIKLIFRGVGGIENYYAYFTASALLILGHIALDYFTIYGVKLLYPFDYTHFDYALIFIIDPIIWIMGILLILAKYVLKLNKYEVGKFYLIGLLSLLAIYLGKRLYIVNEFKNTHQNASQIVYNVKLNPFIYSTVSAIGEDGQFIQEIYPNIEQIPLLGKPSKKSEYPYIPQKWSQNKLPDNGEYNELAKQKLNDYVEFGTLVICRSVKSGAICESLKYYEPSVNYTGANATILGAKIMFNEDKSKYLFK